MSATGRRLVTPSASYIAVSRACARKSPIRNAGRLVCACHASSWLHRAAFTVCRVAQRCGSSRPPSDGSKPGSRRGAVRAVPDRSRSAVSRARIVSPTSARPNASVRRDGRRRVSVRSAATPYARIPRSGSAPIAGRGEPPTRRNTGLMGSVPAGGFVRLAVCRAWGVCGSIASLSGGGGRRRK